LPGGQGFSRRHRKSGLLARVGALWHVAPPHRRRRSSVAERALGKGEVGSSILLGGTTSLPKMLRLIHAIDLA
jgi:hypothetical protein